MQIINYVYGFIHKTIINIDISHLPWMSMQIAHTFQTLHFQLVNNIQWQLVALSSWDVARSVPHHIMPGGLW